MSIQKLTNLHKVMLFALLFVVVNALGGGRAHAATLNVASGTDETTNNSSCSLSEAIQNINDQPVQTNSDCIVGDGTNDTINLPAGTINLSDDLPTITKPITIQGQGMGVSIVDGDMGQYIPFNYHLTQTVLMSLLLI